MFRCQNCMENIGSRMYKIVTEKRPQTYYNTITRYRELEKVQDTKVSTGWEIVKERCICEKCYEKQKLE